MGKYSRAYLCVGGPLDNQWVKSDDFAEPSVSVIYPKNPDGSTKWNCNRSEIVKVQHDEGGMCKQYNKDYYAYNSAGGKTHSMIWVHKSLLRPRS